MCKIYFNQCELQEQYLQRFASDLKFLRPSALTPGEPYRLTWIHEALTERISVLSCLLATEPENTAIRIMLHDYRQLENQAWLLVMQPHGCW